MDGVSGPLNERSNVGLLSADGERLGLMVSPPVTFSSSSSSGADEMKEREWGNA